ncbi:MAG: matrixin family metalloprotease [Bdellovibrio sp.]|nr:matrixin family metalloprotease [Bdellovibrio sp.]
MKIKVLLAAGALILFKTISVPAAGGWTSGGGELIRDQHNPWFIQNTKQVNYCIQIDEKEFGLSRNFVSSQVARTIQFWKNQLKELQVSNFGEFAISVGGQNFSEVDCESAHDIDFQFGVLSSEQAARLGDISKTIALSVRTDYDIKKLKSKGFVYFAKDKHFPSRPWSSNYGIRFLPVLAHEIGHVFGVQHREDVDFMSENYPEAVLSANDGDGTFYSLKLLNEGGLEKKHLFKYVASTNDMKFISCMSAGDSVTIPKPTKPKSFQQSSTPITSSVSDKFFNVGSGDTCQTYHMKGNRFEYFSGKGKVEVVGAAELIMQNQNDLWILMNTTDVINFWLPQEQTIFPKVSDQWFGRKIGIASFVPAVNFKADYKTIDGKISRPITLEVMNNGTIKRISGVMDGILYNDVRTDF